MIDKISIILRNEVIRKEKQKFEKYYLYIFSAKYPKLVDAVS